jgi:DEAD/DEAH box helicase domain-containing protein
MVLDVETRRSAREVGGWHRAGDMGVSVAVLYDAATDAFLPFEQDALPEMFRLLAQADLVVGFNILGFDYAVLQPFADVRLHDLPTLDLLVHVHRQLGRRVSLDNLAQATLNAGKSADGMAALRWWKEGRLEQIAAYCRMDVDITRRLYLHGSEHGHVCCSDAQGARIRVPVLWERGVDASGNRQPSLHIIPHCI